MKTLKNFFKKIETKRKKLAEEKLSLKKKSELIDEIKDVCMELEETNMWFQMEKDSDLIEACIHRREFLYARYRYLINQIKLDKIS